MLGVDLLGERFLLDRSGGDIVADGRDVCRLTEPRDDLLADGLVTGIDVVQIDRRRVRRLFRPQTRDRPR